MLRYFRSILFWGFIAFSVVLLGSFLPIIALFVRNKYRLFQGAISLFSKALLILCGIKVKIAGKENFDLISSDRGLIVAVNHQSFLDSFVLLAKLPFLARFTVYAVGFRLPFLKRIYRGAGYIGVGMRSIKTAHLHTLFNALKNHERVIMYSEVSDDEERFEFAKGLIRLSQQFNVPILPIAIKGMNKVLPLNEPKLDWGEITLSVGKPSSYFSSNKELKEEVQRLYAKVS